MDTLWGVRKEAAFSYCSSAHLYILSPENPKASLVYPLNHSGRSSIVLCESSRHEFQSASPACAADRLL